MLAAIYTRISSDPNEEAAGVGRQEADCRTYVEAQGWTVAEVYTDNDVSASQPMEKRPAFMRLLADAEDGDIEAIVAWRDDRLWRNPDHQRTVFALCDQVGVSTVATPTQKYDPSSHDDRFVSGIRALVAEYEAATTALRVRRAHQQRAADGKPNPGRRAFGYASWHRDELVPDEAAAIREAVERITAGESTRSVRLDFNDRGIAPPYGDAWSSGPFTRMLRSPAIAGLREYHGEVVGKGDWEPIISEAEHQRVLRVLDGRRGRERGRPASYFLSGLVRCGRCESPMTSHNHSNGHRRYQCRNDRPGSCGALSVVAEPVERLTAGAVIHRLAEGNLAGALDDEDSGAGTLEADLAETEERMDELARDYYGSKMLSRREFETARAALQDRAQSLRDRLSHAQEASILAGVSRQSDALERAWHERDVEWQRAVFRALASHVTVKPSVRPANRLRPERLDIAWIDKST